MGISKSGTNLVVMSRRNFLKVSCTAIGSAALFMTGCTTSSASNTVGQAEPTEQTITDMAGREITIATNPTKIMGAANPDGIMIYSIDSSLLLGWTFSLSDSAKSYLDSTAASLPTVTSVSKWEAADEEEILKMGPDFIFVTVDLDNADLSIYDQITADTNIPVVVGDADLDNLSQTYEFLGTILGDANTGQCQKLADFCSQAKNNIDATMGKVSDGQKARVLYSTGSDGTQTCGDSNWNGSFVTAAGGANVCDTTQTSGFATVSMEQVISWKPDVIISTATGDKASIYGSDAWADLAAIKDDKVYAAPQVPFSWVDKPTGVNRVIGIEWTNSVLYPSQASFDIKSEVKDFYSLVYHYDLNDTEITALLNTTVRY
jgi:iron complex transport system substrate-binding protein